MPTSVFNGNVLAAPTNSILVDLWSTFENTYRGQQRISLIDLATGKYIFTYHDDGLFEVNDAAFSQELGLVGQDSAIGTSRQAHKRIAIDFVNNLAYVGVGRAVPLGAAYEGIFRGGLPDLLSHYLLNDTGTVTAQDDALPLDQTGNFTGANGVDGSLLFSAFPLLTSLGNLTPFSRLNTVLDTTLGKVVLGRYAERPTAFSSGFVLDAFVDCGRSFRFELAKPDESEVYVVIERIYPGDMTVTAYTVTGSVTNSLTLPTVGAKHIMLAYRPGVPPTQFYLAFDGGGTGQFAYTGVTDTGDLKIEQAIGTVLIGKCPGLDRDGGDMAFANLRFWDAELLPAVNAYTLPTTPGEEFPEFVSARGIDISAAGLAVPTQPFLSIESDVSAVDQKFADIDVINDALPTFSEDRSTYHVPTRLNDLRDLSIVVGVVSVYSSLAHDRETGIVTINTLLYANPGIIDAEVAPVYSLDRRTWYPCRSADVTNSTSALTATPGGDKYTYFWDSSEVARDGATDVWVSLRVGQVVSGNVKLSGPNLYTAKIELDNSDAGPTVDDGTIVITPAGDTVRFDYTLFSSSVETVDVAVEFSTDGGTTWNTMTEEIGGPSEGISTLTSSPAGIAHIFEWDTLSDNVRWSWALTRITAKRSARDEARLLVDYRFDTRGPVAQWTMDPTADVDFDGGGQRTDEPDDIHDDPSTSLSGCRPGPPDSTLAPIGPNVRGAVGLKVLAVWPAPPFTTNSHALVLQPDTASEDALIDLPSAPITYFRDSALRGLTLDFQCGYESALSAVSPTIEIINAQDDSVLLSFGLKDTTGRLLFVGHTGTPVRGYTAPTITGVALAARTYRQFRVSVDKESGEVTVWEGLSYIGGLSLPQTPAILWQVPIYIRLKGSLHILPGGAFAVFSNVVLLDLFSPATSSIAPSGVGDARELGWHPDSPYDEGGVFKQHGTATALERFTEDGRTGFGIYIP